MQDIAAPEKLRDFQIRYGKYLRDPQAVRLPKGIPARRSEIYEGLLFNNISGFIHNCFPVARSLHSPEEWTALVRSFFKEWRSVTPIFSQIPFEFVRYCSETLIVDTLPKWLPELLHYEWVELEVDLLVADTFKSDSDKLRVNSAAKFLSYNWPVHTISKDFIPDHPSQTFLVVYQNRECKVRFLELNATTFALLQHIQERKSSVGETIDSFLPKLNHPNPEALASFTLQIMKDLKQQEILIGDL